MEDRIYQLSIKGRNVFAFMYMAEKIENQLFYYFLQTFDHPCSETEAKELIERKSKNEPDREEASLLKTTYDKFDEIMEESLLKGYIMVSRHLYPLLYKKSPKVSNFLIREEIRLDRISEKIFLWLDDQEKSREDFLQFFFQKSQISDPHASMSEKNDFTWALRNTDHILNTLTKMQYLEAI